MSPLCCVSNIIDLDDLPPKDLSVGGGSSGRLLAQAKGFREGAAGGGDCRQDRHRHRLRRGVDDRILEMGQGPAPGHVALL